MSEYSPIPEFEERDESPFHTQIPRRTCIITVIVLFILMLISIISLAIIQSTDDNDSRITPDLDSALLFKNMDAFQVIADNNGGTRSTGPGYLDSVNWILSSLRDTKWKITISTVYVDTWQLVGSVLSDLTNQFTYQYGVDYKIVVNSASQDEMDSVVLVTARNQGCIPSDYDSIISTDCEEQVNLYNKKGFGSHLRQTTNITYGVIVQEGECTPSQKLEAMMEANPQFVVMFLVKQISSDSLVVDALEKQSKLPIFSMSPEAGRWMSAVACGNQYNNTPSVFNTGVTTDILQVAAQNLIADWPSNEVDNPDQVVLFGAHLDSPPNSAGINNNAGGASILVTIGIQFDDLGFNLVNRPRLCWWAGGYDANAGSKAYIQSATENYLKQMVAYVNMDVVSSPNYVYQVYNSLLLPIGLQEGGAKLEVILGRGLLDRGVPKYYLASTWQERWTSDDSPFVAAGIVSTGYYTGTEELKTPEQQILFSGAANSPLSSCFDLACDEEYNQDALVVVGNSLVSAMRELLAIDSLHIYLYGPQK